MVLDKYLVNIQYPYIPYDWRAMTVIWLIGDSVQCFFQGSENFIDNKWFRSNQMVQSVSSVPITNVLCVKS